MRVIDVILAIQQLIERIRNETADAEDYILLGELSMWWELKGQEIVRRNRLAQKPHA